MWRWKWKMYLSATCCWSQMWQVWTRIFWFPRLPTYVLQYWHSIISENLKVFFSKRYSTTHVLWGNFGRYFYFAICNVKYPWLIKSRFWNYTFVYLILFRFIYKQEKIFKIKFQPVNVMTMAPEIFPAMMIPENVLVELTLSETNVHSVLPVSLDFQIAKVNKVNSYCNILRSSIHDQTYVKK